MKLKSMLTKKIDSYKDQEELNDHHHRAIFRLQGMVDALLSLFFILLFLIIGSFVFTSKAKADDLNIYNSPSDKTLAVIVYCDDNDRCSTLLTPKATLEEDYPKIEEWVNKMVDKSK